MRRGRALRVALDHGAKVHAVPRIPQDGRESVPVARHRLERPADLAFHHEQALITDTGVAGDRPPAALAVGNGVAHLGDEALGRRQAGGHTLALEIGVKVLQRALDPDAERGPLPAGAGRADDEHV